MAPNMSTTHSNNFAPPPECSFAIRAPTHLLKMGKPSALYDLSTISSEHFLLIPVYPIIFGTMPLTWPLISLTFFHIKTHNAHLPPNSYIISPPPMIICGSLVACVTLSFPPPPFINLNDTNLFGSKGVKGSKEDEELKEVE